MEGVISERNDTCTASKTRPELAAAVGVTGHNWGGRHAAWVSGRPRKCFIRTAVGRGHLSLILVGMGSLQAIKT